MGNPIPDLIKNVLLIGLEGSNCLHFSPSESIRSHLTISFRQGSLCFVALMSLHNPEANQASLGFSTNSSLPQYETSMRFSS